MTAAALTPTQERVLDELLGRGEARPEFPRTLAAEMRDELETELAPVAERVAGLPDEPFVVTKRALQEVHQCERHHLASLAAGFAWTGATARGAVAHKAVELGVHLSASLSPAELVDHAVERLREDDWGPAPFLSVASPVELAELRASASDIVTKFQDSFPPLRTRWRPRLESSLTAELCGARIVVRGKVDLALGQAEGCTARVLIVDLKTGRPSPGHADDLRLYALLETLRVGVPPFRLASYYLDAGTWHAEDVTVDVLRVAARRLAAGTRRLVELRVDGRQPSLSPGPACGYCPARSTCEGARAWEERAAERAGAPGSDPGSDGGEDEP